MQLTLNQREYRLLLDLAYIGNWVLNSTRGEDRFQEYDDLENKLFAQCAAHGMGVLAEEWNGTVIPSKAYAEGGIHDAIAYYEDNIFFEILSEELSRRDMDYPDISDDNYPELVRRMEEYMEEFRQSGVDHLTLED